jgi:hypothetical protein
MPAHTPLAPPMHRRRWPSASPPCSHTCRCRWARLTRAAPWCSSPSCWACSTPSGQAPRWARSGARVCVVGGPPSNSGPNAGQCQRQRRPACGDARRPPACMPSKAPCAAAPPTHHHQTIKPPLLPLLPPPPPTPSGCCWPSSAPRPRPPRCWALEALSSTCIRHLRRCDWQPSLRPTAAGPC